MKKTVTLIIAIIIAFSSCVVSFADSAVKFNIKVLSENGKQAVLTVNYGGGADFASLDFIVTTSSNVKIIKMEKGYGLKNFSDYVEENNQMMIAQTNKENGKFSMATTIPFKAVKGSDLVKLTIEKNNSKKLVDNDIKITFENCTDGNSRKLSASVSSDLAGEVTTATPKTTISNTTEAAKSTNAVTTSSKSNKSITSSQEVDVSDAGTIDLTIEKEKSDEKSSNESKKENDKKKVIIITAVALATLLVAVAFVFYIKKVYASKGNDINE